MVVGEPLEQRLALGDLMLVERGRVLLQVVDDLAGLGVHPLPVLHGLTHVAEHLGKRLHDRLEVLGVGLPVDLDVHPRLAEHVVRHVARDAVLALGGVDLLEVTGDVPAYQQLRVHDHVDRAVLLVELHRHRVDEERHVVGDHLDDRVAVGRPPCSETDGVKTRMLAVPCGRCAAVRYWLIAAP